VIGAGVSAFGARLAPLQPYLIGLSLASLGYAFYQARTQALVCSYSHQSGMSYRTVRTAAHAFQQPPAQRSEGIGNRNDMATIKHTIEIFSAGCSTCRETIDMVKKVAGPQHEVQVHDMQHGETAARAKTWGVRSLPAVVINGKLAGCCAGRGPDEHVIRRTLQ
jgi:glutaredoxin